MTQIPQPNTVQSNTLWSHSSSSSTRVLLWADKFSIFATENATNLFDFLFFFLKLCFFHLFSFFFEVHCSFSSGLVWLFVAPVEEAASPLAQTWSPVPPPGPDPHHPRAFQVGPGWTLVARVEVGIPLNMLSPFMMSMLCMYIYTYIYIYIYTYIYTTGLKDRMSIWKMWRSNYCKNKMECLFSRQLLRKFPIMSKSGDPLDVLGIRGPRWNAL